MHVLGLTGPIGSGKSMVASFLHEEGFVWLEIDSIGHDYYQKDSPVYGQIRKIFKTVQRKQIRRIAFNSPSKLAKLNNLLHPLIREDVKMCLDNLDHDAPNLVVLDAAVLFEIGLHEFCDEVWAIWSDKKVITERMNRKGWSRELLARVLKIQKDRDYLMGNADLVFENNEDKLDLYEQVVKRARQIKIEQRQKTRSLRNKELAM